MNGFLVDTNVVSEPSRSRPNAGVVAWLKGADERRLFLSVITVGELCRGIERVRDLQRRATLERLLAALRASFASRTLTVDEAVAERWGRLTAVLAATGKPLPAIDALIAATALVHDLTIVTRNDRDFERSGASVLNPFT